MGAVIIWGWDSANTQYVRALVDALGHLQVDVLTAGPTVGHCYGWTGAAWTELLVESLASANLRTRLYDGVNPVVSVGTGADIADTNRGLFTQAGVRGWDGTFWKSVNVEDGAGDALTNARASLSTVSKLYGYNGATWDRLRVMTPADAFVTPTMALQVSSFLMGYDGVDWNMVRVDATGHLQIDVLSVPTTDVHPYGYDGANWQRLLVEDATHFNLRVRLYAGVTPLPAETIDASALYSGTVLKVMAVGYALELTDLKPLRVQALSTENLATGFRGLITISALYGFDGAAWDKLRTYGTGILKVGRAEVGLLTVRRVAVGQVGAAGARKLYWMLLNPSAGNSVTELTDAVAGGGVVVADHFDTTRDGHMITFDPPMEFSTGLYLETFTNMTSITFGYL